MLNGRSHYYVTPEVEGTLSIKSVLSGAGAWITPERRYELREGIYLVLNQGQRYSVDIRSRETVETFCVFFQPGFLEATKSALDSDANELLAGATKIPQIGFYERLDLLHGPVQRELANIGALSKRRASELESEEAMIRLGEALLGARDEIRKEASRLPSLKASVREEIFRRLNLARDHMIENLHVALALDEISLQASLSPFHFHRLFRMAYRLTPYEFLSFHRLERAKALLKRSKFSVSDIGSQSGFETVAAFGKRFRASTGMSPTEYRAQFARLD